MSELQVGDSVIFNQNYNDKARKGTTGVVTCVENCRDSKEFLVHIKLNSGSYVVSYNYRVDKIESPTMSDIDKTARWMRQAFSETLKSGGQPSAIVDKLPNDVLESMIRNNIYLVYKP